MNLERNELPPRRSRHTQRRVNVSLKKWFRSGLVVFGALFFGVIVVELYQAQVSHDAAKPTAPSLTVEQSPTSSSQTGAEVQAAQGEEPQAAAQEEKKPPETTLETTQEAPASPQTSAPATPSTQAVSQPGAGSEQKPTTVVAPVAKPATTATAPATSQAAKPKAIRHVVQKGETLYMLSRKYYGNNSNVARIARYNGFHAETQLTAGKVVMVPISP